ncbi:hypothetical protein SLEP1_g41456 [Rubroshorea leprosula]|uniref:Uncharacterized protein n=1 Tax=Rubroshorea leprosula TaxID=152421 RepID=A0AAV5L6L8_9ROSI|nr:hypothetical protein SLEP1_g41456 [Rubroshorea leprosula]
MVLQKRLDYGFNGYQVPATPRATRSARKRGSFKKRVEANQMCPFDLLATVAGKLFLEKENVPSSSNMPREEDKSTVLRDTVKEERQEEDQPLRVETCNQGSCDKKFFVSELVSQAQDQDYSSRDSPGHQVVASVITTSDSSEGYGPGKLVNGKTENEMESLPCQVETGPAADSGCGDGNLSDGEDKRLENYELDKTGKVSTEGTGLSHVEDPMVWKKRPPTLVSSNSSAKAPSCRDQNPHSSFPASQDDVNVVNRDDDENSSGCTHPSTIKKSFRSTPHIGDRRIRKILASKYWKVAPKLKDFKLSSSDEDLKPSYCNRNNCYKRLRSERNYPFKKRKFFQYASLPNSDGGISSEGIAHSPEKGINGDATGSCPKMHGATGESSSVADQPRLFHPRDSRVKLRIKSFRVPELFIEVPETGTVGLLKRTVMDAVTAILGGGLRIGVLIQGKKVRDDNKTLLQTGISHDNQSDVLGFSLEPNPSQTTPSLCPGDSPSMIPCHTPQPLTRYPATSDIFNQATSDAANEPHAPNIGSFVESDHDSAPSPTDMSIDKSTTDSKALVAAPAVPVSVEALAVVPAHRKSKQSEVVQRRIRRPFSVAEVEALVQAVEKLGTGRWRDVKLRAFDNAKHRTYVDLKDKWKTLVHTARISPQQRRGEPVPQELLDRVLTAHGYWSQQQAKQQLRQQPETCLL